jgi:hypothetical protein
MDDTQNEVMPVREKTVAQTPPPAEAPKATPPLAPAASTAPSPETAAAITAIQAAAKQVAALTPATRNTQTALRMLNDSMGLLQKA